MKSPADRQKLYQDYISHYEACSHEGSVTLCEGRGDAQLGDVCCQLIRHNLQSRAQEGRLEVLKQMRKGFAILELICVNLFLFPWRKEIRTLKKFTGNFVYYVEPVIPEDAIRQILQRVGYSIASDTEYTIRGKINGEEAKQTAFELYLSRIQCEKLLRLMDEDRSICVSLLVNRPGTEADNGGDHTGPAGKNISKTTGVHEIDGANSLDFKNNLTSSNNDTTYADLNMTEMSGQDVLSDTSKKHQPRYYINHMDSDEFLNNYSDLNLAQQPIFPLHIKQKTKEWTALVSEEPNFAKESFARESGSSKLAGRDFAEKVICSQQVDNVDIRTFTDNLEPPKSLIFNEPPAEVIVPAKQERVVMKLKMQNVAEDALAYPVEETLPPDSAKFSDSSDLAKKETKWAFLKTKEGTESFSSSMSKSSDFSMLNISNKPPMWTSGADHRVREPPNSTYIPPMAAKSERMRLTNMKPEDNHFQAPSPPGDTLLGNEFKMHEDTKEDYVMITRKDNFQN
ncbi:uncharacterized protein LOC120980858 [Bufo bufo]|uniref:uncharacterized protein LOC120980858 n=1 Tax=Bufo bufo TaxID=8384 RepID=UPI001ABDDE09|nr:uncharacterized protein LOC120980858 [Bufo bufo]